MPLRPIADAPKPSYPEGPPWRRGLLRSLRRVTATGALVGSLLIAGCYGATRYAEAPSAEGDAGVVVDATVDEAEPDALDVDADAEVPAEVDAEVVEEAPLPEPVVCEHDPRLSGFAPPAQYFVCTWDDPSPALELPVYVGGGQLCAGGASVAWFGLAERSRLRIGLSDYAENVRFSVMDSEGRVLTQIGPGQACVELEVDPGAVGLAAEAATSPASDTSYFEFYIDVVEE